MASMRDAIQHGADMVEFDVQVSKDLVPVVYHEFRLCVQTRSKQGGDIMLDIPVKDLSVAELQGLKVDLKYFHIKVLNILTQLS